MAEEMVKRGFDKVGYEYVLIDDCWAEHKRDSQGRLVPDRQRFPNGIKALAGTYYSFGGGIFNDGQRLCPFVGIEDGDLC